MPGMADSDVTPPLCRHLDGLVDDLRKMVPQAIQEFDVEAIHKARVTTRRLKAALDLLDSALDPDHTQPFARLGRKLRRRLGPLRDIDVMLGHLDEIKPTSPHAAAAKWLEEKLHRDRDRARDKSMKKVPAGQVLSKLGSWWAMRQDVVDADPEVEKLLTESLHLQLDAFIEGSDLNAEPKRDPHALRIAGKKLRYTLELAEAQGHKLPKMVLRTFKQMQGFLGLWHDYVVLGEHAMCAALDEELALHDAAMHRQVLKLIDFAMVKAQRQLDGFSKHWKEKGPELTQAIREAFPLTQPAPAAAVIIEPQKDHGPADSAQPEAPAPASTAPPPVS
jgi:CHAD domain-containing protein